MLGSIYIGMSALQGNSEGLRVIANNTANINTPGFKGSSLQFADLMSSKGDVTSTRPQVGNGLHATTTLLNFKQGEFKQTGNDLDLAVDGQGLFTVRDESGEIHYTRAGQFSFNEDQVLVSRASGSKVMAYGANGGLEEVSIANQATILGKPSTTVTFSGLLASDATEPKTVSGLKVLDKLGAEHTLSLRLTSTGATAAGTWKVELLDGSTVIGTSELAFTDGKPTAATAKLAMDYTPPGMAAMSVNLDFGANVSSFASGGQSTIAFLKQDGTPPGGLTTVSFDAQGFLVKKYSNGETVKGARLTLARFSSLDAVQSKGDNEFDATNVLAWENGLAAEGAFGSIRSGTVELSNVDLSREFSELVILQRGYQAASQVISTANDMLQELMSLKGR